MGAPSDFVASLDFREALGLYIFLREREEELSGGAERLYGRLRDFLYGRLSIEEMERPEDLLARLEASLGGAQGAQRPPIRPGAPRRAENEYPE